jgi:hypothetical protein
MNLAAKITLAGSTLVVAGLVALAAPAVAAIGAFTAPIVETATANASAEPAPDPPVTDPAYEAAAKASAEAAGLQYLGDGVSKPMGGPGNCTTDSLINLSGRDGGPVYAKLLGTPVDMGASSGANGTVTLDSEGQILSYTVAAGDVLELIGARLCIDYVTVGVYNFHTPGPVTIHPGDVLVIRPDPTVPVTAG